MQFIAFDLETTGFIPGVDKIVEIGAVRFVNGAVESVFSTLIDPKIPMPMAASKVNGITDEMLQGKPNIERIMNSFADFCGNDIIVAHNASFDYQFFNTDVKKYQSRAPMGVVLDTLSISRKVFPGLPNYKLGTLVQHLDIPASNFHRAEDDAIYCGKLFINILKKISPSQNMPPIENLISLTGKESLTFPQIEPQPKQLSFFEEL